MTTEPAAVAGEVVAPAAADGVPDGVEEPLVLGIEVVIVALEPTTEEKPGAAPEGIAAPAAELAPEGMAAPAAELAPEGMAAPAAEVATAGAGAPAGEVATAG